MAQPIKEIPVGTQFGYLTVKKLQAHPTIKKAHYLCACSCGGEILVRGSTLRLGRTKSCGCLRKKNMARARSFRNPAHKKLIAGNKYNQLTIIRFDHWDSGRHRAFYVCKCECGKECVKDNVRLTSGTVKSCGCLWKKRIAESNKEKKTTHGMSDSPEYRAWRSMNERCSIPAHGNYKHYGGRGIKVDKIWRTGTPNAFENFLSHMGLKTSPRHSLDRIDVNGNYEPGNCRWADPITQRNNQRPRKRLEEYSKEELQAEIDRR